MSKVLTCTFTGVDEQTSLSALTEIAEQYPFVEWGVLYSPSRQGEPGRYMSYEKVMDFIMNVDVSMALHICGKGVPNLIDGEPKVVALVEAIRHRRRGGRVQLNFNLGRAKFSVEELALCISKYPEIVFITQSNDANRRVIDGLKDCRNHTVLFDASGGNGISPGEWPAPLEKLTCGYAGGLGPDNIAEQMDMIDAVTAGEFYCVDMEGKVRDSLDRFDLELVQECIDVVSRRRRFATWRRMVQEKTTVWTVHVRTESSDHYVWVYAKKPTRTQVIKRLWEDEGRCETLKWYIDTTSVNIEQTEVIEEN